MHIYFGFDTFDRVQRVVNSNFSAPKIQNFVFSRIEFSILREYVARSLLPVNQSFYCKNINEMIFNVTCEKKHVIKKTFIEPLVKQLFDFDFAALFIVIYS